MADTDAYEERKRDLFSEHEDFQGISLFYAFTTLSSSFDSPAYDRMQVRDSWNDGLGMTHFNLNVKMSEQGQTMLRNAFLIEAGEWTADLREKEKILEQLCVQLDSGHVRVLNRMLNHVHHIWYYSKVQRYEELVESLSPDDRLAFYEYSYYMGFREMFEMEKLAVNAHHIWDTLAAEFPDIVLEEAKRECEQYELNKGKSYERFVEQSFWGVSSSGSEDRGRSFSTTYGYRLVDK